MLIDSVFLDSSVLIAATLSSTGRARDLVIQGLRGEWRLITSDYVLDETGRNISRKAPQAYPVFDVFRQILMVALVEPPPSLVQDVATVIHEKDARKTRRWLPPRFMARRDGWRAITGATCSPSRT